MKNKKTGKGFNPSQAGATMCFHRNKIPQGRSHCATLLEHPDCVYDVLLDASSGDRSTDLIHSTLKKGLCVVAANKTPIARNFTALHQYPNVTRRFKYSATVCGGLPVLNVGTRDFPATHYHSVRGIFNSTSNFVLDQVAAGETLENALRECQERGFAEGGELRGGNTVDDLASLVKNDDDLNGYDTANKLCIIVNAILGQPCKTADIPRTGITQHEMDKPVQNGHILRMVASALWKDGHYELSVKPEQVPVNSFLGRCADTSMCIEFHTDIFENISMMTDEKGVEPTAAAVLRDILDVSRNL